MGLRLLQTAVSVVECHQETKEGANACRHCKFPSTFTPLLTHTHWYSGFILGADIYKQHTTLLVKDINRYKNEIPNTQNILSM
jgi:hypothetical protein